jgi:outer membrane cobalamin receptor
VTERVAAPLRRLLASALALASLATASAGAQGGIATRGLYTVRGTVRDVDGPVAGARVELAGTRHGATTSPDGAFVLSGVPAGEYTLRVWRLGYTPLVREHVRVSAAGDDHPLSIEMARGAVPLAAVVVTPGYFGLLGAGGAAPQALTRDQLESVPASAEDIYRAVSRLPGVAATDYSARFSVRGATADQLYVTLDGLRLVEPFHLKDIGSALSIIDIQSLGRAELTTGGASAAFGDHVGGVFALHSLDPATDRRRGALSASLTNLRATSQGSFAGGRGGWLVSGRRGFLDLVLELAAVGDSVSPRYGDLFAKVQYDLARGGRIALHLLGSDDKLRYLDDGDESIDSRYQNRYLWLTWRQPFGSRVTQETVLSVGRLDWLRMGEIPPPNAVQGSISDQRVLRSFEVRQDWSLAVTARSLLTAGIDARRESADYEYARHLQQQSVTPDGRSVTLLEHVRVIEAPRGTSLGSYVSMRLRPVDELTVEAGLRQDRSAGFDERIVSPRLAASWQIAPSTTVRGAWGRYVQSQPISALHVEDQDSTFHPANRSEQRELGVEHQIPGGLSLRVDGYDRRLATGRPRFVNTSPVIRVFPEVSYDRVVIPPGHGRSRGVELTLARRTDGAVEWSAGYSLAKATDDIGGRMVPRVMDQRHAVHFDWGYHPPSNRWRFTMAGVWHSGTPDTPTIVVQDTLAITPAQITTRLRLLPGPLYSTRLPAYRRLDMRWMQLIPTRKGRLSYFVELFNALDNTNLDGYYAYLTVSSGIATARRLESRQLPRIPAAGLTWEF